MTSPSINIIDPKEVPIAVLRPARPLLHVLPAVDTILSIGTFPSHSCISLGLYGSVVIVELAVAHLLYLTPYLYLSSDLH